MNIKIYKFYIIMVLLIMSINALQAQGAKGFTFDYSLSSKVSASSVVDDFKTENISLAYETTLEGLSTRFHLALKSPTNNQIETYIHFEIGAGQLFLGKHRFNLPTFFSFGYLHIKEDNLPDSFSALTLNLRTSPRFFLTNTLALSVSLEAGVLSESDETLELDGVFYDFGIGVAYMF